MTKEDKRIILSCFANGFEFRRNMEGQKEVEVKTLNGTETFTFEYMDKLAEMLDKALTVEETCFECKHRHDITGMEECFCDDQMVWINAKTNKCDAWESDEQ